MTWPNLNRPEYASASNHCNQSKTLGDHLRRHRLGLGLLQTEVAQIIGVCEDTIRNWENNRTNPALHFISQIIQFLSYAPWESCKTLGGQLLTNRRALGISQENLAKTIGVDPSTLGRWGRGEKELSPKMQEVLNRFLTREESK